MESGNYLEQLRVQVAAKIEKANNDPISASRIDEIEEKLKMYRDAFVRNGVRNAIDIAEEDKLEAEIIQHSACAYDIVEWKEMLNQIASRYGLPQAWADDMLAHENAHANVAEQTGHGWVGYAAIFIKDESGRLASIQPVHITKADMNWGPRELIEKSIEVTSAPESYGNSLSDGDVQSIAEDRVRLEQIRTRELRDGKRRAILEKDLGMTE